MDSNDNNSIGGQSRFVMILVCLFLGAVGIHNFMFGEKRKGTAKIVLLIISTAVRLFGGWGKFVSILLMLAVCALWIGDLIKLIKRSYIVDGKKFI